MQLLLFLLKTLHARILDHLNEKFPFDILYSQNYTEAYFYHLSFVEDLKLTIS